MRTDPKLKENWLAHYRTGWREEEEKRRRSKGQLTRTRNQTCQSALKSNKGRKGGRKKEQMIYDGTDQKENNAGRILQT